MSKFGFLFFLGISCSTLSAQNSLFPKVPNSAIEYIAVEDDNIFALGFCEQGQLSTDDGAIWNYQEIPDENFVALEILPESMGTKALTLSSEALYLWNSEDGIFETVDIPETNQFGSFLDMEVIDQEIYIISVNTIIKASANNFSWEKTADILYDEEYSIVCSSINQDFVFIGSTEGHLFTADRNTGAYTKLYQFSDRLQHLEMFDNGVGYASIGGNSGLHKTTDGGVTWNALSTFRDITAVYARDADHLFSVESLFYYYSSDGGQTVEEKRLNNDPEINYIGTANFSNSGDLYLGGRTGTILKTQNGGADYINLNAYPRSRIRGIDLNANGFGVAVGEQLISFTEDNGDSWNYFDVGALNMPSLFITDVAIIDDNKYFISHTEGTLLIENGTVIDQGTVGQISVYYEKEKDFLLGVSKIGSDFIINKSNDQGITWENKFTMNEFGFKIKATPEGKYYVPVSSSNFGVSNLYLISENEGEDWQEVPLPEQGYFTDMALGDNNQALFSIANQLFESFDGGITMSSINIGNIETIEYVGPNHFLYTENSSGRTWIYEKLPNDVTIEPIAQFCGQGFYTSISNNYIWIGQEGGHINRFPIMTPNSTTNISIETLQLSPNPITPGGSLQLPESDKYINSYLQLFDPLGQLVVERKNFKNSTLVISPLLGNGLYTLRMNHEDGIAIGKFLVLQ